MHWDKNLGAFILYKSKTKYRNQRDEVFDQLMIDRFRLFFISKTNRKKGLKTMSRYFMYGTSLGGIEQLMI